MPSDKHGPKVPLGNKPHKTNWLEKAGGVPDYIKRTAEHIKGRNPGWDDGHCIAAAVNSVKKLAAKGNPKAVKAIAEWEALKGRAAARKVAT